jgi:hypothetical protein
MLLDKLYIWMMVSTGISMKTSPRETGFICFRKGKNIERFFYPLFQSIFKLCSFILEEVEVGISFY